MSSTKVPVGAALGTQIVNQSVPTRKEQLIRATRCPQYTRAFLATIEEKTSYVHNMCMMLLVEVFAEASPTARSLHRALDFFRFTLSCYAQILSPVLFTCCLLPALCSTVLEPNFDLKIKKKFPGDLQLQPRFRFLQVETLKGITVISEVFHTH